MEHGSQIGPKNILGIIKIHTFRDLVQKSIFGVLEPILEGIEKSMIFWSASERPKIKKNRSLERLGVEKWAPVGRQVGGGPAAGLRRSGGGVDFGPRVKGLRD